MPPPPTEWRVQCRTLRGDQAGQVLDPSQEVVATRVAVATARAVQVRVDVGATAVEMVMAGKAAAAWGLVVEWAVAVVVEWA